jgi:hypothetical protein
MMMELPNDTYCFVIEETYDKKQQLLCYFRVYGGLKSNNRDVPDDDVEVEVWALTVADEHGNEIRIDAFDFTDTWDHDWLDQYIVDNLSELTLK